VNEFLTAFHRSSLNDDLLCRFPGQADARLLFWRGREAGPAGKEAQAHQVTRISLEWNPVDHDRGYRADLGEFTLGNVVCRAVARPHGVYFRRPRVSSRSSFWINDGLMRIFFFVVGLEIRSEVHARFSDPSQA